MTKAMYNGYEVKINWKDSKEAGITYLEGPSKGGSNVVPSLELKIEGEVTEEKTKEKHPKEREVRKVKVKIYPIVVEELQKGATTEEVIEKVKSIVPEIEVQRVKRQIYTARNNIKKESPEQTTSSEVEDLGL